jgi:hypothetical protein
MRLYHSGAALLVTAFILSSAAIYAQESYEDYRYERDRANRENPVKRDRYIRRDEPLSEVRAGEKANLYDDRRGAIPEENDPSINKESKAGKKSINENELIKDVRRIVREEIQDAIKIRDKKYLVGGTWEMGGFVSATVMGLSTDEEDNNFRFKVLPLINYFLGQNIALSLRGEADFNMTANQQIYYGGAGPMFAFAIDRKEHFIFYTTIYAGVSVNNTLEKQYGFRYGNEMGMKFVLTSGVILNLGAMMAFDNGGDQMDGFQNIIIPTFGITAWF